MSSHWVDQIASQNHFRKRSIKCMGDIMTQVMQKYVCGCLVVLQRAVAERKKANLHVCAVAKRKAHSPLRCYQPPPQARQRLTHLAWYPHTQTRLGQSHCHTQTANEMRMSIRHALVAACRDTQPRASTEHARQHAASFARLLISNTFSRLTKSVFGQRALLIWGESRHGWGLLLEQTDNLTHAIR